MSKNKSKTSSNRVFLVMVFVILLIMFAYVFFRMINNFQSFRQHRNYFQLPLPQQHIQQWMTINSIERHYHLDVGAILKKPLTFSELKESLATYCTATKLDCEKVIVELENAKNHP